MNGKQRDGATAVSRRTFVTGLAASAVVAGTGPWNAAWAEAGVPRPPETLAGRDVTLTVGETSVNLTGHGRTAVTVNGSLPGPLLRWREGETVTLRVVNALREDTSIHWHGIVLPANMDGSPGFSFHGIAPGGHYDYRFRVRQAGTYWYHSHSGFQEQEGLYGPIIIDPVAPEPFRYDREHVVLLSDWTDARGAHVFSRLKKQSDYYNRRQRTVMDFFRDVGQRGARETLGERGAWGRMRMSASDLADVSAQTYTYLMNGTTPAGNWTGLVQPGERVRLRFINGSGMTYFDVRIPGLAMTVVAADGQPVRPVTVDELRIAVAETYDVIVEPADQEAYTIVAQSMDRTGYARGTLAVRPGLAAPVPVLDPRPVLTMADMGHGDHGAHAGRPAATDPHAGHAVPDPHAGHGMPPPDPHAGHAPAEAGAGAISHPMTERGNGLVDMQVVTPAPRLDDPGLGLRDNGRRVLTYADLQSAFDDPDGREPGRTIELHLTGHMERYAWSFNGVKFSEASPLRFTYGERLRIVLVNDSMMAHPIHLHGMWSDLEDADGRFLVRKHTINMPPGTRRSFRVTADALGRWPFHCHLLFHMAAGMFREVRVEE